MTDDWEGRVSRYIGEAGEEYFSDSDDSFRALAFSDDADEDDSDIVVPYNFSNRHQQRHPHSHTQSQNRQSNATNQQTSHHSRHQQVK